MIEETHIALFIEYDGDHDLVQRLNRQAGIDTLAGYEYWSEIEDLVQRLTIRQYDNESTAFKTQTDRLLKQYDLSDAAIGMLRQYCMNQF